MDFLKLPATSVARGGALCGAPRRSGVYWIPSSSLRFRTDFLFLMFVSFISPQGFDLGRNHMGWGTGLEGGGLVRSAVRLRWPLLFLRLRSDPPVALAPKELLF